MNISKMSEVVSPYQKFLIGFSGGLDSTVLLHRFKMWRDYELNIQIRAIHVHHGLNLNADNWVKHCIAVCNKWNIPLIIIYVNLVKEGLGIEAQARKARYAAFKETLSSDEALVTAQHLDDQCETFLLALKRGSGPSGLSAMPLRKKFANTHLLRPLLNETRKSLITWAKAHSLYWIEDKSNMDDHHDRNFLRMRILPIFNERWPYISTTIARSAELCAEQESLIDELLLDELSKMISKEGALEIAPLMKMSILRRAALLRRWFLSQGALMPSRSMLNRVWEEVVKASKGAIPYIYLHGYYICRFKGMLWRIKAQLTKDIVLSWHYPYKPLILPQGLGVVSLKNGGHISIPPLIGVSVRFNTNNLVHIAGREGKYKLKKIWQYLKIPPWESANIPLLFYGETLIAAAGKFITKEGWLENGVHFGIET